VGWGLGLTFPANPALPRGILAHAVAGRVKIPEEQLFKELSLLPIPPLPLLRIDYIFSTDALRAVTAYTAEWDGQSDHRAVVAEFQFAESP
jgi:hypothetical protein